MNDPVNSFNQPASLRRKLAHVTLLIASLFAAPLFAQMPAKADLGDISLKVGFDLAWNVVPFQPAQSRALVVGAVREVFAREGSPIPVEELGIMESPQATRYLLTLRPTDWKMDGEGNVDCTFMAELKTPTETQVLGPYTLKTPSMAPVENSTDKFARDALKPMTRLFEDIVRGNGLPGLEKAGPEVRRGQS